MDIAVTSKLPPIPTLPATLTMPGPNVTINLPNGNAFSMPNLNGNCAMTIGVTSTATLSTVNSAMSRPSNYSSCNPQGGSNLSGMNTVKNFINDQGSNAGANPYGSFNNSPSPFPDGDPRLANVAYLNNLASQIGAAADYAGADTGNVNLGTPSSPQIVVIDGNFSMGGNTSGAGLLVVTGTLSWNGTPSYQGQIFLIGDGSMSVAGGGNGGISMGGVLLANTHQPNGASVGTPTISFNGGGNATWSYDDSQQNGVTAKPFLVPNRVGFRQLSN